MTPEKPRNIILMTGRGGAMFAEQAIRQAAEEWALGRPLTEEEKLEIQKTVESQIWEGGAYEVSNKGIVYKGLHDQDMPDGIILTKVRGTYYIERWKNGSRVNYEIITEEKFEELKVKSKPL